MLRVQPYCLAVCRYDAWPVADLYCQLGLALSQLWVKGIKIPALGIEFEGMFYGESINVIGDFLKLTFVENPGMAFGIDVGETSKLFLSIFSLVASLGILVYLFKLRNDRLVAD